MLRVLGVLSILLPVVLLTGSATFDHCTTVLASISHYYYTTMGHVFVGVLGATGLALFLYKGDNATEIMATRFAAVCILGVALLPTSKDIYGCGSYAYHPNTLGELWHKAFAAFFLLTMSAMFCLFARSNSHSMHKQVRSRNRIYRVCAATISIIVLTIVALSEPAWFGKEIEQQLLLWTAAYKPIFWLEWLALVAVGTSWLIKSGWLLADPVSQPAYRFLDDSYQSEHTASAKFTVGLAYLQEA